MSSSTPYSQTSSGSICRGQSPAGHGARRRHRAPRYPVLDAVAASFARLCEGPGVLRVRTGFGHLPLGLVRSLLADPATAPEVAEAVWRTLIGRSRGEVRGEQATWILAAVGCALPRLRSGIWHATRGQHVDRDEACQAALAAFTDALLSLDPLPAIGVLDELVRRGRNAAQQVADRAVRDRIAHLPISASMPPPVPAGHPDLVLAGLVRDGVIDREEAEIIGRHRLEGVSLRCLAAERGDYPVRLSRRVRDAEARIYRALVEE